MITNLKIKNILGINKEIEVNLLASPKQKTLKNTVVEIDNLVYCNKLNSIIGANASGKSSIVVSIDNLISFIRKTEIVDTITNLEEVKKRFKDAIFDNMFLLQRNLENLDEESEIEMECYIGKGAKIGMYKYHLSIIGKENSDISMLEELFYKKKYTTKNYECVSRVLSSKLVSDIGYKVYYKDTVVNELKSLDSDLVEKFEEKMEYYNTFYEFIENISVMSAKMISVRLQENLLKAVLKEEKLNEGIINVLKIVDDRFEGIVIENRNDKEELIFKMNNNVKLRLEDLSLGTKKLLNLFIHTLEIVKNEGVLVIDEIDSFLHRELVDFIVSLVGKDKYKGQVIFTVSAPEVLDYIEIRKDQIFYLDRRDDKVEIKKLVDAMNKNEKNIANIYYKKISSLQPSKEKIKKIIEKL